MSFYIIKSSGEKELFNIKKFKRSLHKAGAPDSLIKETIREIEQKKDLRSTKEIYDFALSFLDQKDRPIAARYNLKKALMDLGPSGFPFEKFIAKLFIAKDYDIQMNQVINGFCVQHEVDVSASKKGKHYIIECKFHNRRGLKSDVKVALYIKARYDDIEKAWNKDQNHKHKIHGAWIVTNTRFSSQATKFGLCAGLNLLDWKQPEGKSLPDLINELGLHPITALTSLNKHQKLECIKAGFVLCKHASEHTDTLHNLKLSEHQIKKLVKEAEIVCSLTAKKQ